MSDIAPDGDCRSPAEQQKLDALLGDETRWWLCQQRGVAAHATLVLGWSAMVKLLAADCINTKASPEDIQTAERWLTEDRWLFGHNGTAYWYVYLEDGGWSATLVTRRLDESQVDL